MSNVTEFYFNGGVLDGQFINLPSGALQHVTKRVSYAKREVTVYRYERIDANNMQLKETTTQPLPPIKYRPRNELVLIRIETVDTNKAGIALPQQSLESRKYIVEAKGPKVEDLEVGDKVLMNGEQGQDWNYMPGCNDLLITHQLNVSLVIEED